MQALLPGHPPRLFGLRFLNTLRQPPVLVPLVVPRARHRLGDRSFQSTIGEGTLLRHVAALTGLRDPIQPIHRLARVERGKIEDRDPTRSGASHAVTCSSGSTIYSSRSWAARSNVSSPSSAARTPIRSQSVLGALEVEFVRFPWDSSIERQVNLEPLTQPTAAARASYAASTASTA